MVSISRAAAWLDPASRAAMRWIGPVSRRDHPLTPKAVRLERTKSRSGRGGAEQSALTVWFGEGPELPVPGNGRNAWRSWAGVGAALAGAAVIAALGTVAAEREQRRIGAKTKTRAIDAPARRVD